MYEKLKALRAELIKIIDEETRPFQGALSTEICNRFYLSTSVLDKMRELKRTLDIILNNVSHASRL